MFISRKTVNLPTGRVAGQESGQREETIEEYGAGRYQRKK